MRKATKIWLIIAALLVVVGCVMFALVMSAYQYDFDKLSTETFETNIHEISSEFSNISMNTDTAGITFALSNNGKCRVECYEEAKAKHFVAVQDDTLVIKVSDEKSWYDYIGINVDSPKITVYLPEMEYTALCIDESTGGIEIPDNFKFESVDISVSTGAVKFSAAASNLIRIEASTGSIHVENISAEVLDLSVSTGTITVSDVACAGDVNISVSTGKTNLTDVTCKTLTSSGNTGDISLSDVIATEKFSIERSTGDVKFDGCDAAEIFVVTDTGDVTGSLLTDKIFMTQTDTGDIDVPKTTTGGKCEISTDTGDIHIGIE